MLGRTTQKMDSLLDTYRKTGSQQAFAELVARYTGAVFAQCLRQVRDRAVAEDATQAVFVLLAQKAATLPEGTILEGWLFNTARYTCLNILRMQRRRRRYESAAAGVRPETARDDAVAAAELKESLDAALAQLSERDRKVITLRYYGGRTIAQVASELGITEDAAKQRVSRAVERIRQVYQRSGSNAPAAGMVAVALEQAYGQSGPTDLVARIAEGGTGSVPVSVEAIIAAGKKQAIYSGIKVAAAAAVVVIAVGGWLGMRYGGGSAATVPVATVTPGAIGDTPKAALQRFVDAALGDDYAGAIAQTVTAVPEDRNVTRAMLRMNMGHDVLKAAWQQRFGDVASYPELTWLSIGEIAKLMVMLPDSASVFEVQGDAATQRFRATLQEIFGADATRIPAVAGQWLRSTPRYRLVDGNWRIEMDRTIRVVVEGIGPQRGGAEATERFQIEALDVKGRVYREVAQQVREGKYATSAEAMQALTALSEQALAVYSSTPIGAVALPAD